MTKFYWIIISLIFIPSVCLSSDIFAEDGTNNNEVVSDTISLSKNIKAAKRARKAGNDSLLIYAKNALAIADRIIREDEYHATEISKVKTQKLAALKHIVSYYSDLGSEYDSALVYGVKLLEIGQEYYDSEKNDDYRHRFLSRIAGAMMDVGVIYFEESRFDSAISFYNKVLEQNKLLNDSLLQSKALLNLGMVYNNIGRYEAAIENYYTVIKIFEQFKDKKGIAITYLSLGSIYRKQGSPEDAIKAYNKSLQLFQEMNDERGVCACYNNLGIAQVELENYNEGLAYYNKALEIYKKSGHERSIATMYTNMAVLHEKMSEYDKAIELVGKATEINRRVGSQSVLMGTYVNLSGIYLSMVEEKSEVLEKNPTYTDTIVHYAELGMAMADSMEFFSAQAVAASILRRAYALQGRYQKAYKTADLLIDLNDSIYNADKAKIISEANAKFEAEQKEQQIKRQQQQIDNQQLKLKSSKTFRNLLAIISVLMFMVLGLFYYLYKQKHKANKILDEKSKQIERQNKEITRNRDELEEAYKKLNELLQFKEKMTGMIVHDLKNPVNNILNSHIIDDLDFREKLINQSGYDMLNLIQNILDLHRLEEAELEIQRDMVLLAPVIRQSIFELSLYIDEKNLKVVYPESETDYFSVDIRLLKRIFSNLLSNAVKYATDNSDITIDSMIDDSGVRTFSVYNLGPSIPQDKQAWLFDRFNQLDSRDIGNSASTGLGLAFCKMAVELHGGKIGFESDAKGTKFWFTLPG